MKLKAYKQSRFYELYNLKDPLARGRSVLLGSGALSSLAAILTSGAFYTSFLVNNGINLVNIGILTFVPYLASCFSILSPVILERIQKRKWVLSAMRLGYYLFLMLGVTVIPKVTENQGLKTTLFVLTIFIGHVLNALSTSGYSSWHVNFLPESVRAEHLGISVGITNFLSRGSGVLFAMIADAYADTPSGPMVIELFRYVAVALGILDVFLLSRPKEFPYAHTAAKPKFRDVFVKPFQNKKFLGSVSLYAMLSFCNSLPAGVLNYFLLEDLGLKYTFIDIINFVYPFAVLLFLRPCRHAIKRFGWLGSFAIGCVICGCTYMAYGFASPANYLFLFPAVRLTQHFAGSHFLDTPMNNLAYLNLPNEDRTNYMSFYVLLSNVAAFLGTMTGTWFVALTPNFQTQIGSIPVGHCQVLLFIQGFGILMLALITFLNRKTLSPETM